MAAAPALAVTVGLLALTSCGSDGADESKPLSEGGRLTIGDTVETETGTVTIRSYEVLQTAEDDEVQPPDGRSFAVVDMEGCVDSGRGGVVTIYSEDVHLQLTDGTLLAFTRSAKEPALQPTTSVRAGNCARGFLTFAVPRDSQAERVIYEVIPRAEVAEEQGLVTLSWTIP